jgi:hypothetical protein
MNCNTAGVCVNFFILDFELSLCTYVLKSPPFSKCLCGKIMNSYTAGVSVNFFVLDFAPSLCIYVLKSPP